jgi:hypothetical protein
VVVVVPRALQRARTAVQAVAVLDITPALQAAQLQVLTQMLVEQVNREYLITQQVAVVVRQQQAATALHLQQVAQAVMVIH